jgi:hypothetical protein
MKNTSKTLFYTFSIIILLSCGYKDTPDLKDKKFGLSWNTEREKKKIPLIEKGWSGNFTEIDESTKSVFWNSNDDLLLENTLKHPERTYPPQHNQKEIIVVKGIRVKEGDFYTNLSGNTHYTLSIFFSNLDKPDKDSTYAVLWEEPNGKILKQINKQQSIAFKSWTLDDFKNPKMEARSNALMSKIYDKYAKDILPTPPARDLSIFQADSVLKSWGIVQELLLK